MNKLCIGGFDSKELRMRNCDLRRCDQEKVSGISVNKARVDHSDLNSWSYMVRARLWWSSGCQNRERSWVQFLVSQNFFLREPAVLLSGLVSAHSDSECRAKYYMLLYAV